MFPITVLMALGCQQVTRLATERREVPASVYAIFVKSCNLGTSCHSPDVRGLSSIGSDSFINDVPGDSNASSVVVRLTAAKDQTIMPPADRGPLDPATIDKFRKWIDEGAGLWSNCRSE